MSNLLVIDNVVVKSLWYRDDIVKKPDTYGHKKYNICVYVDKEQAVKLRSEYPHLKFAKPHEDGESIELYAKMPYETKTGKLRERPAFLLGEAGSDELVELERDICDRISADSKVSLILQEGDFNNQKFFHWVGCRVDSMEDLVLYGGYYDNAQAIASVSNSSLARPPEKKKPSAQTLLQTPNASPPPESDISEDSIPFDTESASADEFFKKHMND